MINVENSIILIAIAALITFALRLAPFAIFGRGRKMPAFLSRISAFLPTAIMGVLVIYCLKSDLYSIMGITKDGMMNLISALAATVSVILIHLWKRNTLLSVAIGTIVYMLLIRL